jgi:hypothetical protein
VAKPGAQIDGARARTGGVRPWHGSPHRAGGRSPAWSWCREPAGRRYGRSCVYRCDDPFAVEMVLSICGGQSVTWTVGRDLFRAGVRQPSGLGDVHVYPVGSHVVIELGVGAHRATLIAHRPALEDFLAGTESWSPRVRDRPLRSRRRIPPSGVPVSASDKPAGERIGRPRRSG